MRYETLKKRFFSQIAFSADCWIWTGCKDRDGYGKISKDKKPIKCHRFAYEIYKGPIGKGKCVCHTCDNPACLRPSHLFVGTHYENMMDKVLKGRHPKGENIGMNKLTEKEVRLILSSKRPSHELSNDLRVSVSQINRIRARTSWSHIEIV